MIRFENVTKEYPDGTKAVDNLNFTINNGEFFVLIGPSGCGKTTTLKMINRLIELTKGTIYIQEKKVNEYDIHTLRWNIGYVLQQIALFPHMTIAENIATVPELKKWKKAEIHKRTDELMDMVGLDPVQYRNRKPNELSGGQQQRVGVIRALAADPDIILMDEPFSALDPLSREQLQSDLLSLKEKIQKTIIFVTHDMQEAIRLGDRICLMNNGKVVQIDTPEEMIKNPTNDFVRHFIGINNEQPLFDEQKSVEDILEWVHINVVVPPSMKIVSSKEKIVQLVSIVANEGEIAVEHNGKIIGTMTSQTVLQCVAKHMEGRA